MFDYSKPIIPQVLEYMEEMDYPKESITLAKNKMLNEKDLDWTINFIQTLAFQFIGKSIMKGIDEGKIHIDNDDHK